MLIGVTGGIGSGKTTVARRLGELLEAPVFIADECARSLLQKNNAGYGEVLKRWGNEFLDATGRIDRPRLRKAVFSNAALRSELEEILHPLVRNRLKELSGKQPAEDFLIAEVPLLYESGWEREFDLIICVYTPASITADRAALRDGESREEIEAIVRTQLSPEIKRSRADHVIDNSGDWLATEKQVTDLACFLRAEKYRSSNCQKAP